MSYNGPATLILENGREVEVQAHFVTGNDQYLESWSGYLTAENRVALLNAVGNGQIRLPDGRQADLLVKNVRTVHRGNEVTTHAEVLGSGDRPY